MVLTNYIPLFPMPSSQACCFQSIALNPSAKAPVKFHFKIDGRHEKVLNRTDRNGNVTWPHERAGIHSMGSYTSSRQYASRHSGSSQYMLDVQLIVNVCVLCLQSGGTRLHQLGAKRNSVCV